MEFHRCGHEDADLMQYAELFRACFPSAGKLGSVEYLKWLYVANPCGPVVGFNAWEGGRLAAHYVCVPARFELDGRVVQALLSLNTATHPDFQGRGLFTSLAELTYQAGADEGSELIYGVANANSTPGFVRKLGFTLVSSLESRVGIARLGSFDWPRLDEVACFRQAWTPESLDWRMRNPAGQVSAHAVAPGLLGLSTATGRPAIRAWAELPCPVHIDARALSRPPYGARVWLGLMPKGFGKFGFYPHLPVQLRPSPLNLIVRSLRAPTVFSAADIFFNFLDFDAF